MERQTLIGVGLKLEDDWRVTHGLLILDDRYSVSRGLKIIYSLAIKHRYQETGS